MSEANVSFSILIVTTLILLLKCDFIRSEIKRPGTNLLGLKFTPEDAFLNFTGLAWKYGHPPEVYQVETQDGYILELYHLPGKRETPILLMHGFLDSSDTWIMRGEKSLGIHLANDGYDVWLGNTRGNRYSTGHVELKRRNHQYWKFSIHEIGYYDLPAIIDRVLSETGARHLTAIGHSQGNAIFYILGSTRPEYNAKVNLLIALAPISYMHNTPPPVSFYLKVAPILARTFRRLGVYNLLRYEGLPNKLFRKFCSQPIIGYALCAYLIFFPIIGFDPDEFEEEFFRVFVNHLPAGTSLMNYEHYGQIGINKRFARYDYGPIGNLRKYNSTIPPSYDLGKVTMPVALFAGKNDPLSALKDVELLRDQLPNYVAYIVNPREQFCHGDSVWGKHMDRYLFPYIYDLLKWFDNNT